VGGFSRTGKILSGKLALGGITQSKTKIEMQRECTFQSRITGCSIVLRRNKHV